MRVAESWIAPRKLIERENVNVMKQIVAQKRKLHLQEKSPNSKMARADGFARFPVAQQLLDSSVDDFRAFAIFREKAQNVENVERGAGIGEFGFRAAAEPGKIAAPTAGIVGVF